MHCLQECASVSLDTPAIPFLHTYLALQVQPWFSLEMLFYYLTFPAMLFWSMRSQAGNTNGCEWLVGFTAGGIGATVAQDLQEE